ncbi:MAG TPA: hypothetical protein QF720_05305 [Nitrospinota bacterium]|nr:hypothetical protein [Nitrospinota bacterium]|tara:strand:+ start:1458 stop:2213 length:756 start_codon:yes stop_codon:yes gene_type:complete
MFTRLKRFFAARFTQGTQPKLKKISDYAVVEPEYRDWHVGSEFLVYGNGPTVKDFQPELERLVVKRNLIVMGVNNTNGIKAPDYHFFINRRRFCNYAKTIHHSSKVILSPAFPNTMINEFYQGPYELLQAQMKSNTVLVGELGKVSIDNKGIIFTDGAQVSTIAMAVAIVMGARVIYVAGMDGFSGTGNQKFYHYDEKDFNHSRDLEQLRKVTSKILDDINNELCLRGGDGIHLVTPGDYDKFYTPIENFL